MQKPTLMFVASSDFDSIKSKGVEGMIAERSEGGYFGNIISIHPLARKSRVIEIGKNHRLFEFGFDFFPFGSNSKLLRLFYSPGYVIRAAYCISRLIKDENVDVVRASDPYWAALITWIALKMSARIPFIISIHADWDKRHQLDPQNGAPKLLGLRISAKMLSKFLLRRADRIFCIRKSLFKYVVSSGGQLSKIRLIPHGIDFSEFEDGTSDIAEYGFDGKKVIFFAGRLSKENYVRDIIAVAQKLKNRKDVLFVLAGSGPEEKYINELLSADTDLSKKFRLLGSVPRQAVFKLRKAAYLNLVFMGGYSLIEACASGRPTVAYDVEWHSELIQNGKTGWLVPEGDIEAANSIVLKMLECENLADEVGCQGRRAAFINHELHQVYKIRSKMYAEILGDRSK